MYTQASGSARQVAVRLQQRLPHCREPGITRVQEFVNRDQEIKVRLGPLQVIFQSRWFVVLISRRRQRHTQRHQSFIRIGLLAITKPIEALVSKRRLEISNPVLNAAWRMAFEIEQVKHQVRFEGGAVGGPEGGRHLLHEVKLPAFNRSTLPAFRGTTHGRPLPSKSVLDLKATPPYPHARFPIEPARGYLCTSAGPLALMRTLDYWQVDFRERTVAPQLCLLGRGCSCRELENGHRR
jgi:hypothetical protein